MLQQKCIFKLSNQDWFTYLKVVSQYCSANIQYDCSRELYKYLSMVRAPNVQKCLEQSSWPKIPKGTALTGMATYFTELSFQNSILESEIETSQNINRSNNVPALFINEKLYQGHLKFEEIMAVVCENFDVRPQACEEVQMANHEKGHRPMFIQILQVIWILVLGLIVISLCCVCLARRAARLEVEAEIRVKVEKYINLPNTDTAA